MTKCVKITRKICFVENNLVYLRQNDTKENEKAIVSVSEKASSNH